MLNQLRKIPKSMQTSRRGVSLIELIMVIAISSFMIAIALAGLNNSGRSRFDDGMRQVLNNLREVQNQAANGQAPSNGLGMDQELFGKGIWFSNITAGAPGYTEYFVWRPIANDWTAGLVGAVPTPQAKPWPGGIKLTVVASTADAPPVSKGMIVFARGVTGTGFDSQTSSSALPFFFTQDSFSAAPSVLASSYNSPQTKTITLTFTSGDGKYTSKIVINCATGTMELVQ